MATRVCSVCGKTKDLSGGKTCDKEHFVCKGCAYSHSRCPLDGTKLK